MIQKIIFMLHVVPIDFIHFRQVVEGVKRNGWVIVGFRAHGVTF